MSTKIDTPHDSFFKATMGRKEVAESFLNNYLPPYIKSMTDLSTLKPEKDSFIDEEMATSYADLLVQTRINGKKGYLYFLFEHKAYFSKTVAHQLLKYITAIWDAKINKEKSEELPIVIPLFFYHGKAKWDAGNSLGELVRGYNELSPEMQKHIPNFEFLLYDMSVYRDEEIIGHAYLQAYFTIVGSLHEDFRELTNAFMKAMTYIIELDNQDDVLGYFKTMVRYILSVGGGKTMPKEEYEKIVKEVERIYPQGSEVVVTIADMLRSEGMEQGINISKVEIAIKAIKKGMEISEISDLTGLTEKEIRNLIKA